MIEPRAVIIDYGVGNLLSVRRAVEECGANAIVSCEPNVIFDATHLILPGVGAFTKGMQALETLGLVSVIRKIAENGVPLLGICLGMQLLFDQSEEYGLTQGLGIIPGRVVHIPKVNDEGAPLKVPHIGWSELFPYEDASWDHTPLQKIKPGDAAYFVHSYMSVPTESAVRLAYSEYGGIKVSSVIRKANVIGCQFHPEKSGEIGLRIIRDFLWG